MRPSSSEDEDRSTTGTFSEGLPYSSTGNQGWREEIFDGDPSGGGDPEISDGGIEPPLGEEESSLEGERERLVPLLSSIVAKRRERERKPKQSQEGMRDGYQCKTKGVFIAHEVPHSYNNGHHFGSYAPTRVHGFENRVSVI
jgi:hypothetical protein